MGKFKSSILGSSNGSVGDVVVTQWRGVGVIREKAKSVHNPKTPAQLAHRAKFATMIAFLQEASDFVNIGFKRLAVKMTASNAAMQENMSNVVVGDYPDYTIDVSEVKLSKGKLRKLLNPTISSTVSNELILNWVDNTGNGNALETDKLLVLAYSSFSKDGYCVTKVSARGDGEYTVVLPSEFSGQQVHVIVGLISVADARVSDSQYIGEVLIA